MIKFLTFGCVRDLLLFVVQKDSVRLLDVRIFQLRRVVLNH